VNIKLDENLPERLVSELHKLRHDGGSIRGGGSRLSVVSTIRNSG
jgi:hypothetical protein